MLQFIKTLFTISNKQLREIDIMKRCLIVGLGNIGLEYEETRHNIGFKVLDFLSKEENFSFKKGKLGSVGTFTHKGKSVLCLKPSTYMNLSGKAVKYWMEKEKILLENVLIITDDIHLPFGTFRLRTRGSHGGHNGLRDIQYVLETSDYNRFRFGVGSRFNRGEQVDYVLGKWNIDESLALPERLQKSTDLIRSFVFSGVKNTMNEFNGT